MNEDTAKIVIEQLKSSRDILRASPARSHRDLAKRVNIAIMLVEAELHKALREHGDGDLSP